ncbi:MAG: ABC transporter ATP-binding protein/permease [Butyrivibrio sp.]|nr:ABC transporter ATP-binding protein/permease [Acetatifactor muris]MCM1559100.1 ABC transporter ATP-binding protein/permease [Butyrivibrio sp.]
MTEGGADNGVKAEAGKEAGSAAKGMAKGVTMRAFKLYSANNPKYFPVCFLEILFEKLAPFFNLWMSSEIVSALYGKAGSQRIYLLVAVTLFGNFLVRAAGAVLRRTAETQEKILKDNEAAALNRKTLSLDYDKMENPDVRQHRRKITESSQINGYGVIRMTDNIKIFVQSLVSVLLSLAFLGEMALRAAAASFRPAMALLFAALVICLALGILYTSWNAGKASEMNREIGLEMLEQNRFAQGYAADGMDNRIYRQQTLLAGIHGRSSRTHYELFSKLSKGMILRNVPAVFLDGMLRLCSYLIICFYCTLGVFPVGSVIKYVGCLGWLTANIGQLLQFFGEVRANEPFLRDYLDYFDIPNDMYQGSLAVEKRSDRQFEIAFHQVSFRYAGQESYALKDISLQLKAGERLAVVGENGSGKTTFIKLLCRLYDPSEGEIYMNDFNIRKYDYGQYLSLFSVVFQDYTLLSLPLGNNVASAAVWDETKAERLLKEAGFGERYGQMPKGLETPIYKDFDQAGVNLSGGEAQKVALARALYKDAPFIILDEPTAALDPVAEAEIYERFDEIVGDKTAIYISHRLSSCRFCDKIVVFDRGRIVQAGAHAELLADTGGKYYELWNAQAQYYSSSSDRKTASEKLSTCAVGRSKEHPT